MSVITNISRYLLRSRFVTHCSSQLQMNANTATILNKSYWKTYTRDIHCGSKLFIKMFREHENMYAYNIMKQKGFAIDIEMTNEHTKLDNVQFENLLQTDWSNKSLDEILDVFPKLGIYCCENTLCISNKMFDSYIDSLTDCLHKATDEQLVSVFYSFNKWPETASIRTRNFIEVWAALDDVCLSRINQWTFDQLLSFVSLFYMLNVTKVSDFSKKSLNKLASKAKRLTPEQLIQTLFFVGIHRQPPYDMHDLEVRLNSIFSMLSVDELAIISMGFFKSRTPIRSCELVNKFIHVTIENSHHIHELSLAALLKVIRYSYKVPSNGVHIIVNLLDALLEEIPRFSVMCNVHIALLATSKLVFHKGCLDTIADIVIKKMSQTRLKDLERLVLAYGTFQYVPKSNTIFFEIIINELRKPYREDEIKTHGRSFACCIQFLGLLNMYPTDLISRVLNPEFLLNTYGKHCSLYGKEILTLHNIAEIFCKNKKISCLSEKQTIVLAKKYTDYMPTENYKKQYNLSESMILEIRKLLEELRGGSNFVVGDHILTHHQRGDIIMCNSMKGSPLPILHLFHPETFGIIRRPPDSNVWVVLVIAGRNAMINNIDGMIPTGQFQSKLEELRHLGYHANLVPYEAYVKLETIEEKKEFLKACINDAIKYTNIK